MSETVTFNGVQVPVADVLAAAERIKAKPVEPGMYRLHHRTDADPFAGGYVVRRKNADGSWDQAQSWGEWQHLVSTTNSSLDQRCRSGSIVPLQPVEGVEYVGGDHEHRRWHNGKWEYWNLLGCWYESAHAPIFWRDGLLRPAQPTPWVPTVGEWVQHKTQPWDKARQVVAVVLDRVRLGNDWMALDCVRKATPDEEADAKRIEPVDRLIVRSKADGSVWQYHHRPKDWLRLDMLAIASGLSSLDLDHFDILSEYTVQGAQR